MGSVRQNLSLGHIGVDEFHPYKSNISLIISDSLHQHFGKVPLMEFKETLVKYSLHRGKNGVSVITDLGSYFFKRLYRELLDYELSLPTQFSISLKMLCVYHQSDYDNRLSEKQKDNLVEYHEMTIKLESI